MKNSYRISTLKRTGIGILSMILVVGGTMFPCGVNAAVNPLKAEKVQNADLDDENIMMLSNDEESRLLDADVEDTYLNAAEPIEYQTIEVSEADELIKIVNSCRLDTWSRDKRIRLEADIHLAGKEFVPFPTFGGVFDGNGHTIDGMNLTDNASYLGFISKLQPSGVVKNLSIAGNITPTGKQFVIGGIVGDNYGRIENCSFTGLIKGNDYTGAITGYNEACGTVFSCESHGTVLGQHYTGGIAGTNCGGIYNSVNSAKINTANVDRGMSIEDININQYLSVFGSLENDTSEGKGIDTTNNTIDTGGIVGHSSGIVEYCTNTGEVGYERVGYNIGGIAGRQSGYLHGCNNKGTVLGRKDVGGIVGQAEPYVQLDLTEDVINELTININELHDYVDKTLSDMDKSSDKISNRLNLVQTFVNNALNDTSYLSNETISFVNGMTGAGNEALSRADYIVDEAGKEDGALEDTKKAVENVGKAASNLENAVNASDVKAKMSESDSARYEEDKTKIKEAGDEHQEYYDKVYGNNYSYYIYIDSKTADDSKTYKDKEDDLKFYYIDSDGTEVAYDISSLTANYDENKLEIKIYHEAPSGEKISFPATEGEQASFDAQLMEDAANDAARKSNNYADDKFNDIARTSPDGNNMPAHSYTYNTYISQYADDIVVVVEPYARDAAQDARPELEATAGELSEAAGNLKNAVKKSSGIFSDISSRGDITLPSLSDEYRTHSDSFVANMKGMSEHLGYLNTEMNESSDTVVRDMQDVNDSFNTIMILFTDAMDGALDGGYADKFEDESFSIAGECIDGAIADCINTGIVSGDIDVSGIAGAMGIEYDFDLEGDMTGNQENKISSTFKTKCVLRADKNSGRITAQKSYVAGVCGLQEMGTIIRSENYGRIASSTGDYVGGIVGSSNSAITNCYSKGIMSGDEYVGGIAGYGHDIYDSYAIPSITEYSSFAGAIAGEVDDKSSLENNYFVSDSLAGIDRVSYSKMAEPMSYKEFIKISSLPVEFSKMQITFLIEDQEIGRRNVEYGHSMAENQYPDPVAEDDFYIDWDTSIVHDVTNDMEIIGEPALYRTTIASSILRDNNQSVILVDGKFKANQKLDVVNVVDRESFDSVDGESIDIDEIYEIYDVVIPKDGQKVHQIRMQLLEESKGEVIYISSPEDSNKFLKASTKTLGKYELFDAGGDKIRIVVMNKSIPIWKYVLAGVMCAAIFVVVLMFVMNRKGTQKSSEKKHKSHKEKKIKKEAARKARKEKIEIGIEKAQQLLEEAKDDSPRGEKQ